MSLLTRSNKHQNTKPIKKPKGSWKVWLPLYIIAGAVDLFQVIIDLTGVGVAISEALDICMAFFILAYIIFVVGLKFRDAFRWGRLMSILTSLGADAITAGAAPAWIIDVWYLHRSVRKDDVQLNLPDEFEMLKPLANPLNENGRRNPMIQDTGFEKPKRPLNINGVRPPNANNDSKTITQDFNEPETKTSQRSNNNTFSYAGGTPSTESPSTAKTSTSVSTGSNTVNGGNTGSSSTGNSGTSSAQGGGASGGGSGGGGGK